MYLITGLALVVFLQLNDLFFFTTSNIESDGDENLSFIVAKSLITCINGGIFVTSVVVWPLVLATCILQRNLTDDEV